MSAVGRSPSISSANLALSPSVRSVEQSSQRENDSNAVIVISRTTSPGASSVLAIGSPGQRPSRASSPEQAQLPALPKYPGAWDSLSSSPEYRKAESTSAYYTAAWGSPYATPSPRRPSWTLSRQPSVGLGSVDNSPTSQPRGRNLTLEVRPPESLRTTSTSSQIPRHLYNSIGRAFARDLPGRQGRSIKEFTEDWINQYLSGQPRTERTNWLSDDEGSEAPSFITARNHFADDLSDGWLGLDDERDEDLLKTPTVATFLARRTRAADGNHEKPGRSRHQHVSTQSTDTLKQEDYWGFAYGNDRRSPSMSEIKDASPVQVEAGSSTAVSPIEKPLPPPPLETAAQESSTPTSPKFPKRLVSTSAASTSRLKKRTPFSGKVCIIQMPTEDKRGSDESGYHLLSRADVDQRLKEWSKKGYDTRGFDVYSPEQDWAIDGNGGLSRPSYPDPAESQPDWETGKYSVRFPNLGEWEAYVNFLKEEKLRALGVSLGDDEPSTTMSPASMVAMTHVAGYPGMITSPPIPTSSAASNHMLGAHPFSPHFNQSTNPSTNAGSLASPPPQFSSQHPFFGLDSNLVAGLSYPYQPTPPTAGTFTPQSLFNARQAGVSSTGPTLPSLSSVLSPVSPLNPDDTGPFHHGMSDAFAPRRNSVRGPVHRDPQDFSHQTRQSRAATLIARTPEPEHYQTSNIEIAQPTPRGHSHNLSETLQKGLDRYTQADYHLEESIQRQLEENDGEPNGALFNSRWAVPEDEVQPSPVHAQFSKQDSFSQGHHRLFGEQQSVGTDRDSDEIDTNPSLTGTPREPEPDMSHHPWHSAKGSTNSFVGDHKSKTSLSRLNVEAKEFDPKSSFSSNSFTFPGQRGGFDSPSTVFSPTSSVFKPSGSLGGFNVAAPSFTPTFNSQGTSFSPNGFTFSAASFNADAPTFNIGRSVTSNSGSEAPDHLKSRIFGDVDFSQMNKSSKRNKAIPIVRPDDSELDQEKKGKKVEVGAQGPQPRQKRARRGAEDGDKDAEIGPSSVPLGEAAQPQVSSVPTLVHKQADGKENAAPADSVSDSAEVKALVTDKPVPMEDVATGEKSIAEPEVEKVQEVTSSEAPKEEPTGQAKDVVEEVAEEKSAVPVAQTKEEPVAPEPVPVEPAKPAEPVAQPIEETKKTRLSAFARPFSFRPSIAEFIPGVTKSAAKPEPIKLESVKPEQTISQPVKPAPPIPEPVRPQPEPAKSEPVTSEPIITEPVESEPVKSQPPKPKPSGLMASRYAVLSPPSSPKIEETEETQAEPEAAKEVEPEPLPEAQPVDTQGVPHDVHQDSPDEQELNAIMEQLNGDDSDVGIERLNTPRPPPQELETPGAPSTGRTGPPELLPIFQSDAPSPSPRRNLEALLQGASNVPKLGSDIDTHSQIVLSHRGIASGARSPVRHLVSNDNHVSDWDDVISSGEDEKLVQRSKFFDRHINELVGNVLEERLGPLEEALGVIQHSVVSLNSRPASRRPQRSVSAEIENSDADDEDEEDEIYRPISPLNKRDRKLEKMKNAFLEALVAHNSLQKQPEPVSVDLTAIEESIAELKALSTKSLPEPTPDIKSLVQEAIAVHFSSRQLSDAEEIGAESLKLQVDGLKSMLRTADERAESEYNARRDARESLVEIQKLLKIAEEDAARHRHAAEDAEENLRQFKETKVPHFERIQNENDALKKEQESIVLTFSELSEKNIALQGTLDEYRVNHDHWKRKYTEVQDENKDLNFNINHLKTRIEDSMRARQSLRGKFDRLQDDMVTATRDIAKVQAIWHQKEEDLNSKYDALKAAYDREVKLREKLELDIGDLEQQEREAAKLKFIFGQSQQENARLEELIAQLRQESHEYQNQAARFEQEFNEARESSRFEIQRTRTSMGAVIEAANNQVNYIRAELEAQIVRVEGQLESVRLDADTTKERYELLLEEARENQANAVAEVTLVKETAMDEQRKAHERVLNDLRERHARALHNASEDRQRTESHLTERWDLANENIEHLQDKVAHLGEKLEIAKSAARAAAQAAQAKGTPVTSPPAHSSSPSISFRKDSLVPEKISPQALRESILVLQDQLQQREARIEELEQEVSSVDKDAPNKIKERDTEINWLRELLGVRVDDLQDIINTLSQPSFDQHAVRDAAIRLRANLQMEQQEKERAMTGGKTFPSLANLTVSPRSLPLAAAAAWGNWRKGRELFTSGVDSSRYQQTPSKTNNGSGFLSGLLTPPSSNVGQSPQNLSAPPGLVKGRRTASESRPLRGYSQSPRSLSARQAGKLPVVHQEPPTTPPLLRRSSYDHDAEPNSYDSSALMDDGDSILGGPLPESPKGTREGPFEG